MDIRQYEQIKAKIDTLKTQRAKAEGTLETILSNWKDNYKITSLEDAEALEKKLSAELEEVNAEIDEMYVELKGLTNWGLV